jgi:IS5 family transposase
MFKLLFIGYLYGVRSERQLMREVQVNVAYRWFARFRLTDKVPDASTFSQNRRRRFTDTTVYQEIFDEIVHQAMGHGMVDGRVLYTHSTHLKANANRNKLDPVQVEQTPSAYLAELDAAVDADRAAHGKKPLKCNDAPNGSGKGSSPADTREIKVSRTDPDSGYMVRDDKPRGFFYLDHRTVDAKHAIITDTHVTPDSVQDSQPHLARLDRQRKRFGFDVRTVGLDAGYYSPAVCQGLEGRGIAGVMGYRTPNHKPGMFYKREYEYDAYRNEYIYPQGQALRYSTANREGYREYKSIPDMCPALCGARAVHQRHQRGEGGGAPRLGVGEGARQGAQPERLASALTRDARRRWSAASPTARQLHGHRYARMRGLRKVAEQCMLAAAAQNIKKIALLLSKQRKAGHSGLHERHRRALQRLLARWAGSFPSSPSGY